MPEPLTVGCFLKDVAHEGFILALVERVAGELGMAVNLDVRNATGGKGRVMAELRRHLRDVRTGRAPFHSILVVAIDGNCITYHARREQIERVKEQTGYPGDLVCAVPDPHIERWYLADVKGFKRAIEGSQPAALPAYKCERGRYKNALRQALRTAGIEPRLDVTEYARETVEKMDLYRATQADAALKHFVDDLRATLRRFA